MKIGMLITILCIKLLLAASAFATVTTYTTSGDLDSGTVSLTTTHNTPAYLRQVAVNFSAAPEAAETITVKVASSVATTYDATIATYVTVAAGTTTSLVIFDTPIQVDNTHQIKVSTTNASQSVGEANDDPTAYISVLVDTVAPSGGGGLSIFRNGLLLSSSKYPLIQDEGVTLAAQRGTINFTGTPIACTENATTGRTDCTLTADGAPHVIKDETSSLTNRANLNFTGAGVTCSDNALEQRSQPTTPYKTKLLPSRKERRLILLVRGSFVSITQVLQELIVPLREVQARAMIVYKRRGVILPKELQLTSLAVI
jgi:hypothetical protein